MLPNKLYKWNGQKWIEVAKSTTDRYAYEEEYIKYITGKIVTGTVDAGSNHKVVVIDAVEQELEQLKRFLQTSQENFDVYLYSGEDYDLEWLNYVSTDSELILINDTSQVKVTPTGVRYQSNLLEYFEQIELDSTVESLL